MKIFVPHFAARMRPLMGNSNSHSASSVWLRKMHWGPRAQLENVCDRPEYTDAPAFHCCKGGSRFARLGRHHCARCLRSWSMYARTFARRGRATRAAARATPRPRPCASMMQRKAASAKRAPLRELPHVKRGAKAPEAGIMRAVKWGMKIFLAQSAGGVAGGPSRPLLWGGGGL
jgi:hypothetical protein